MATQYISDRDHYDMVVEKIRNARSMLWIGTADIKDLNIKRNGFRTFPWIIIAPDKVWC